MDRVATQVVQHRSPASEFNSRWVHVTQVNVLWNHVCVCVGGGEVQVGMCTSVMGLGKGLGLHCRGPRAGGPSGSCLWGHYQGTSNCGHYQQPWKEGWAGLAPFMRQ